MTAVAHAWAFAATVNGRATDVLGVRTSHAVDQPVGTASLDLALPVPSWVNAPCPVTVTVLRDGSPLPRPLFVGTFRDPDANISSSGNVATLTCEGPTFTLTYPFDKDLVYAGGARGTPVALSGATTALHVGAQTIAWYSDGTPDGTIVDRTFTPTADSTFIWVAGRLHGTNSYDESTGDKTIKSYSRVEIRQGGQRLGYAHFPENNEQWSSQLDYTNDANWDDFELFVACDPPIDSTGGAVTVRFVSGYKPGSQDRDEYEVKSVTWQIAGRTSVRNIVRGLFKRAGFPSGGYSVNEVTDADGTTVYLGGNGLVDAGQVRMTETDQPIAFANGILDLYGFAAFDCPDGMARARPIRGVPSGSPVATFTEGLTGFSFRTYTRAAEVYNAVLVDGASGTDQNGTQFAYAYETASPPANEAIPTPPGVNTLRLSSTLLTSNNRCQIAGRIAEMNHADRTIVEWETWPQCLNPGDSVRVVSPTLGVATNLFLTGIRHDLGPGGFRCSLAGWRGIATPFAETPDPNEAEDDAVPTDPRPRKRPNVEWLPYTPSAATN